MSRPTDERLLYLIKSRGPVTARDAGAALAMTPVGAQQWFAKLAEAGLVAPEDRRHGRGRPLRYWALTEHGHRRFPDRHSDLTLDMLASTRAVFGADGLERLIAHREAQTLSKYEAAMAGCATLQARVAKLVALRSAEGYMADWQRTDDGGFVLVENHCPICAAAAACQGLCRSELAIFRAVLGPGATVERTEHVLDGARRCAYAIGHASQPAEA